MKNWTVSFAKEAEKDYDAFDFSAKSQINNAILKVSQNPLPKNEGGYGTTLGNKRGKNLSGLCRIKLLKLGIRVIYKLIRTGETMNIIVIAARADDEVYDIAAQSE
jgi:mRNA interferase RelE/StbE